MATVTGLTAARMLAIEAASVVSGLVNGSGRLILTKFNGATIDAGNVIGPVGPTGPVATMSGTFAARPAASAGLNGQIYYATDKTMAWMCIAAAWVLIWVYAPEVTVLPTAPIDQQECIFIADAFNGVKWHLRYRAASSNASKWECIGGVPIHAMNVVADSTTSTSLVLPGTPVSLTVPLAGYYECLQAAGLYNNTAGHYTAADFALSGIGTGVIIVRHTPSVAWAFNALEMRQARWRFTLTAGQVVDQRVAVSAGSGTIGLKFLSVMPVRVG